MASCKRGYRALWIGSGKGFPGLLEGGADIVVDGPHHLGRSGKVVGLQHWKKLVFLAGVMDIDFRQALDKATELLPIMAGIRW